MLHRTGYYHVSRYHWLLYILFEMAMSQNLTWYDYKTYIRNYLKSTKRKKYSDILTMWGRWFRIRWRSPFASSSRWRIFWPQRIIHSVFVIFVLGICSVNAGLSC